MDTIKYPIQHRFLLIESNLFWYHSASNDIIEKIWQEGWDPSKNRNSIYGTAVYLSNNFWNKYTDAIKIVLDIKDNEILKSFCSKKRGTGSTQDYLISYLQENNIKTGRSSSGGLLNNNKIRDHFLSLNYKAISFDEHGMKVIPVYDPKIFDNIEKVIKAQKNKK